MKYRCRNYWEAEIPDDWRIRDRLETPGMWISLVDLNEQEILNLNTQPEVEWLAVQRRFAEEGVKLSETGWPTMRSQERKLHWFEGETNVGKYKVYHGFWQLRGDDFFLSIMFRREIRKPDEQMMAAMSAFVASIQPVPASADPS
jgi:hypothetical protein